MSDVNTATNARPRRERPKAIRLSDAAAARIREIMTNADGKYLGVRVGVRARKPAAFRVFPGWDFLLRHGDWLGQKMCINRGPARGKVSLATDCSGHWRNIW